MKTGAAGTLPSPPGESSRGGGQAQVCCGKEVLDNGSAAVYIDHLAGDKGGAV